MVHFYAYGRFIRSILWKRQKPSAQDRFWKLWIARWRVTKNINMNLFYFLVSQLPYFEATQPQHLGLCNMDWRQLWRNVAWVQNPNISHVFVDNQLWLCRLEHRQLFAILLWLVGPAVKKWSRKRRTALEWIKVDIRLHGRAASIIASFLLSWYGLSRLRVLQCNKEVRSGGREDVVRQDTGELLCVVLLSKVDNRIRVSRLWSCDEILFLSLSMYAAQELWMN